MRVGLLFSLLLGFIPLNGSHASPGFYLKTQTHDENGNLIATAIPSPLKFEFKKESKKDKETERLKESIQIQEDELLNDLSHEKEELYDIKNNWIDSRPPEEWEDLLSLSIGAMTGLLILPIQSIFEINEEFKLQEMSGLLFLFFPFEDYYLFQNCGGEEYLIAVSFKPTEETLNRMLSLEDQAKLCHNSEALAFLDHS